MTPPEILALHRPNADQVVIDLVLPADAPAFDGHFPGHPILPGVVQLDWAMQLAAAHLGLTQPAAQDFQVKFRRVIQPGDKVSLILTLDRAKGRLGFEYRIGSDIASSGRVKWEDRP